MMFSAPTNLADDRCGADDSVRADVPGPIANDQDSALFFYAVV